MASNLAKRRAVDWSHRNRALLSRVSVFNPALEMGATDVSRKNYLTIAFSTEDSTPCMNEDWIKQRIQISSSIHSQLRYAVAYSSNNLWRTCKNMYTFRFTKTLQKYTITSPIFNASAMLQIITMPSQKHLVEKSLHASTSDAKLVQQVLYAVAVDSALCWLPSVL